MQKPIARSGSAWWPGGRTSAKPPCSAASIAVPAASAAASYVVADAESVVVEPGRLGDRAHVRDVLARVAELELVLGRRAAFAAPGKVLQQSGEPFTPLRMLSGRVQASERRMGQDVDRAIPSSSSRLLAPCATPTR